MATPKIDYRRHVRRPVGFIVLSLLLGGAAIYLGRDVVQRRANVAPVPSAYTYTVKQSVNKNVEYFPSSFYDGGPGKNGAYIMSLTDKIAATFHYSFSASQEQSLSYAYDVRAVIKSNYSFSGDETDATDVWSKEFQLLKPVHGTMETNQLVFTPSVEAPFDEYRKIIEGLRTALTLPVRSQLIVTFTVNVSGVIDGTPFNDLRTASISAPIEEQIYAISQKYDREDTKQVVTASAKTEVDKQAQYEMYGAILLAGLSLAAFVYGLRKQIFKTPYQRELDKIYRYHDGIIIRASKQPDLRGKEEVQVQSFDDMLNLEEELKAPIVAMSVGGLATRFMIIRDDIVYMYHLGDAPRESKKSLERIANSVMIKDVSPAHDTHHTDHKK